MAVAYLIMATAFVVCFRLCKQTVGFIIYKILTNISITLFLIITFSCLKETFVCVTGLYIVVGLMFVKHFYFKSVFIERSVVL